MTIPPPTPAEVLDTCVNTIGNVDLRERMRAVRQLFLDGATGYAQSARNARLFSVPPNNQQDDDNLIGNVTKSEVKNLYSYNLVRTAPGRVYYDAILASAPRGICPLCGVGFAATLDHYMPKAKFPLFSVLPSNLVPACRDCNTGKLAAFAVAAGSQSLHPYFDHGLFITDQWIFAEVIISSPATIRFFVSPPPQWLEEHKERVRAHFAGFELARRFSILAANELSSLNGILVDYVSHSGPDAVRNFLSSCALTEQALHMNSWRTAFFQALSASDWFCRTGFR